MNSSVRNAVLWLVVLILVVLVFAVFKSTKAPGKQPEFSQLVQEVKDGKVSNVVINSAKGEQKDRNIRTRRRVALCVSDPANPYRYLAIRGPVVEITEQGADEVIDQLSAKYTGNPHYTRRPGERRVTYRIRPDQITAQG